MATFPPTHDPANVIKRLAQDWGRIAKEPITGDWIGDTLYAFGSELAMLRLFHAFCRDSSARIGFSKPKNTWYFSKDAKHLRRKP